jgi:hypothetical protein
MSKMGHDNTSKFATYLHQLYTINLYCQEPRWGRDIDAEIAGFPVEGRPCLQRNACKRSFDFSEELASDVVSNGTAAGEEIQLNIASAFEDLPILVSFERFRKWILKEGNSLPSDQATG